MEKFLIFIILFIILLIIYVITLKPKKLITLKPKQQKVSSNIPLPTEIKIQVVDDTAYFFWKDVEGVDSYKIYFADTEKFTPENARTIEKIETGEFMINNIPNGVYFFRLVSVLGKEESQWSDLYSIVILHHEKTSVPEDFEAVRLENGDVRVSWKRDPTAYQYKIMMRSVGEEQVMDKIHVVTEAISTIVIDNLDPERRYFCSISVLLSPNVQSDFTAEIEV